jgi:hypothetical protein
VEELWNLLLDTTKSRDSISDDMKLQNINDSNYQIHYTLVARDEKEWIIWADDLTFVQDGSTIVLYIISNL